MTYSKLTDSVMLAHSSNYTASRTNKITRITPHHMAGNLSADACAKLFQQSGRGGSANYCIDGSGRVACSVPEESRAWTSSSSTNDNQAVTFELANSAMGPNWPVSDTCLNKFIDVAVDVCQRYGITKLVKGQNLTWHSMYAATACLPMDTELLTPNGWVTMEDIKVGDTVATAHMDDLRIRFDEIYAKVEPHERRPWTVRGLTATADHRVLYDDQNGKRRIGDFKDTWGGQVFYIPNAGELPDSGGLNLSDNEIKYLCAVQADGSYMNGNNGNHGVEFHFMKRRKVERLEEILNALEKKYSRSDHSDGSVSIRLSGAAEKDWAERYLDNKKFTWVWLWLSSDQAKLFLSEILLWDGCLTGNDYASRDRVNIDVVTAIAALHGVGTRQNGPWRVAFTKQWRSVPPEPERKREKLQLVSCVSVPSGLILIRQNGRTTIVGNCPGPYLLSKMDWIAETVNNRLNKNGWVGTGSTQQYYDNGKLLKGWFMWDKSWFYADNDGYILFGWHKLSDRHGDLWRYFKVDGYSGRMFEGLHEIDGVTYYLQPGVGNPTHKCELLSPGFDPTIKIG